MNIDIAKHDKIIRMSRIIIKLVKTSGIQMLLIKHG